MIDEEQTWRFFGYISTDFAKQSHKPIVVICDTCGNQRLSSNLRISTAKHQGEICRTCSQQLRRTDPEDLKKTGEGVRRYYNTSGAREKKSDEVRKVRNDDPTIVDRISDGVKKAYENDPILREKASEIGKKLRRDDPTITIRQVESMKANFKNPDFRERHHMWYNDEDLEEGIVMLSPWSHRIGHAFLRGCGVKIPHINIKND